VLSDAERVLQQYWREADILLDGEFSCGPILLQKPLPLDPPGCAAALERPAGEGCVSAAGAKRGSPSLALDAALVHTS